VSSYFKFCWCFQKLFDSSFWGRVGGCIFRLQWTVLTSISSVVLSIPLHSPSCQASLLWSFGHLLYRGMNPYLKTYRAEEADCDCEWCGKCHWPKRALGNCAGAHSDCQVCGAGEHGKEAPDVLPELCCPNQVISESLAWQNNDLLHLSRHETEWVPGFWMRWWL